MSGAEGTKPKMRGMRERRDEEKTEEEDREGGRRWRRETTGRAIITKMHRTSLPFCLLISNIHVFPV
jgi:hypothetical protein